MRRPGAWSAAVLAGSITAAAGCYYYAPGPSRLTVENRTSQDLVILSGYEDGVRLFVRACGQAVLELGPDARAAPTAPPGTSPVEIRYQFPVGPEGPTIGTFTITSERIWTGGFPSPPPCAGAAPPPSD
jgi:hypothetical protein